MKRRQGIKGKPMHRLQVLISDSHFEKLRQFAPEHGSGAVIEDMIDIVTRRLKRKAEAASSSTQQVSAR